MADTQRTRAAILALFADNTTGQISAQDLRDFVVTVMESEFANPGDFWKQPDKANLATGDTAKGWIDYSCLIDSGCSFGNALALTPSNTWRPANASQSVCQPCLGLALGSYASGESQAQVLRRGLIYHSAFSASFAGKIGRPVYLASANSVGSITASVPTNSVVLGVIADDTKGKWFFDPEWSVRGS
ncbi:MAG: hypothetical protein C4575_09355 [Desulforudis sp.]|nr:MAG: hypothetical protein C4575_09355 [Desulforudis sp.]